MEEKKIEEVKKENTMTCTMCNKGLCSCKKWLKVIVLVILGVLLITLISSAMHGGRSYHNFKKDKMNRGEKMHMMKGDTMQMNHPVNMGGMMASMTLGMQGKTGKDLEKAFLTEMIVHHQGAVDMAKMIVADPTTSTELKAFAQNIITTQEKEITQMSEWLKK